MQQVAASSPFSAQLRTHECAVVQLHPVNLPSVLKNQFLCGRPRGQEQCGHTAGEADLLTPMAVSLPQNQPSCQGSFLKRAKQKTPVVPGLLPSVCFLFLFLRLEAEREESS